MTDVHPIQRLYRAEDLVRRRRAEERRRQVASQRAALIDPNPHQIDAVIFALARLSEGGCILADEVGLGKTIEAGLVIAQLRAEGSERILVITPKALLGQWKQELYELFGIDAHEMTRGESFSEPGVLLATRDMVGSEAGSAALSAAERFDLCVIDEAHEVFAGIHRRFDRHGAYREDAPHARMAGRLSRALRESGTPVLLLTATPIQNSLLELWGLVHYIDPTGTLLGDLPTFRDLFCPDDGRVLAEGQEHELQRRLGTVLKRTLRRQAQEFIREPFVGRQARLFEYSMSPEERALYDDVTTYLLQPSLHAFRGNQRTLLLLGFHRRMASSLAALSASLEKVADRLRRLRDGQAPDDAADRASVLGDLEEDDAGDGVSDSSDQAGGDVTSELARVEDFIRRARALPGDGKARALVRAIRLVMEQAELGKSSGRAVIFTESLTTQDYLRKLLVDSRLVGDGDITMFRGTNNGPRAMEALDRWQEDIGRTMDPSSRPSPDVAMRLALVHEFRTRSRILISTEAGAKGLNLQFCDTVINYDLPWNPQRIEQRIGRCHRYGQKRDVTVINFLASDNAAQQLTYEILAQKLDLFGTVLGASDEVLHRPAGSAAETLATSLGAELEGELRGIYERARTLGEVEAQLRELRDRMGERRRAFEDAQKRTEDIIRSQFDASVRQVFARIQNELPGELAELDRELEWVVKGYLDRIGAQYRIERGDGGAELVVEPSDSLPPAIAAGVRVIVGQPVPGSELRPLHVGHPLVQQAIAHARGEAASQRYALAVRAARPELEPLRGRQGRLRLVRVSHRGFELAEHLLPVVVLDGEDGPLAPETCRLLFDGEMTESPMRGLSSLSDAAMDDAVDELLFADTAGASAQEQARFERTLEQVQRFLDDRVLLLERQRTEVTARLRRAEHARDTAVGYEQRSRAERALQAAQSQLEGLEAEIERLRGGDDETYRRWRDRTHERRYARPDIEGLVEAELAIT